MDTADTMDTANTGSVALLMGGLKVTVTLTAHGATVVLDNGEATLTMDSETVEGMYETVERLNADYTDLAAKYQRMDEGWKATLQKDWAVFEKHESQWNADRKKLHEDRMSMARRFIDANQRAYQAERRVRELEAKVECLEQDLLRATA